MPSEKQICKSVDIILAFFMILKKVNSNYSTEIALNVPWDIFIFSARTFHYKSIINVF